MAQIKVQRCQCSTAAIVVLLTPTERKAGVAPADACCPIRVLVFVP